MKGYRTMMFLSCKLYIKYLNIFIPYVGLHLDTFFRFFLDRRSEFV